MSHWYDSTLKKSRHKRDSNPGSSAPEADAFPLGQRGGADRQTKTERQRETETEKDTHTDRECAGL